ncbi:thioester domain-containing protein [Actinoalloteichus hymeniacidonis]|uniref:TQXA domain containing protein n=1 Tax=Actinoalloteichus hymeniacidonis TaxID=340345 RepID=A0AAC9MW85_9PSEU|nr:thioester domain-containing protein [Actinoalloteichus hymeniacidonis]AOS61005.1 TQXA domain containing protein [Actinoalloteichus hymeniacidonis]MBB5910995.1 TQXA domain-containing protein/LPXTG-motif cell wall-anchored protein [Actinoalloteichus hymeniacidonis]
MGIRMRIAQTGAALLGAAAIVASTALPAFAATRGELLPTPNPDPDRGTRVSLEDGGDQITRLLSLGLDDGTILRTYCVELTVSARTGAPMVEVPWDQYPTRDNATFDENREHVLWILQHSFPTVSVDELNEKLGLNLNQQEAIGGTQAAIWHYSNGAELDGDNDGDVRALFDYLTGEENVGIGEQPTPSLQFSPAEVQGEAGSLVGPFSLETTADVVTLGLDAPEGVQLVSKSGDAEPIAILDGEVETADLGELFLDVPAEVEEGGATITAEANATVDAGRLFIGDESADWGSVRDTASRQEMKTQSLIVAESTPTDLQSQATAEWVAGAEPTTEPPAPTEEPPAPTTEPSAPGSSEEVPSSSAAPTTETDVDDVNETDDLADTGASILLPIIIGVVLVGGGAGALLLMRRKKTGDV